ncbi:MAG: hypothetical protein AAF821_05275 [Cyanobacteria bacterium P01_D01_bin.156]
MFGENAALNLDGAFTAATATGLGFGDHLFDVFDTNSYLELTGNPNSFIFASETPGSIVNEGNLTGDTGKSIMLLGGSVINTGSIVAPDGGEITVAAVPGENQVRISQENMLLSLTLETLPEKATASTPTGIEALALPELLTGMPENMGELSLSANQDGTVALTHTNSTLSDIPELALITGTLDASGDIGGDVAVLGDRVALVGATVNASGDVEGGNARIGGDYQGQGNIPNATQTYVSADSVINADAVVKGDGGRVIVWADEGTQVNGQITALGGNSGGNGGFVEISGQDSLVFTGEVDVTAPLGIDGTVLFDPTNIEIRDGSGTGTNDNLLPELLFSNTSDGETPFVLYEEYLESLEGNIILQATENIIIKDLSDNALSFSTLQQNGTDTTPTRVEFITTNGNFRMEGEDDSVVLNGRDLIVSSTSIRAGDITIDFSPQSKFDSSIFMTASSGDILTGDIMAAGRVELSAQGSIVTEEILNFGDIGLSEERLQDRIDNGGVFLTANKDVRVVGISSSPGRINVSAGGLFQATGTITTISNISGTDGIQISASVLDEGRVSIDADENTDIKEFLIARRLLNAQDGSFNDEFVTSNGEVFVHIKKDEDSLAEIAERDAQGNIVFLPIEETTERDARKFSLIDTNSEDRLIRLSLNNTPVSINALFFFAAPAAVPPSVQITHSGRSIETGSENISINGEGEGQFIIGPRVIDLDGNFRFDEYLSGGSGLALARVDYSSQLDFGSDNFPNDVSGTAGAITIGLTSNATLDSLALGVEYDPPDIVNSIENSVALNATLPTDNLSSEKSSEDIESLVNEDVKESSDSGDLCSAFNVTELLSVSEILPEECQ